MAIDSRTSLNSAFVICLSKNPKDRPKLENLAAMLKGISRSESADSQPINDGRTLIVDRTSLEQSIQTNSETYIFRSRRRVDQRKVWFYLA